MIGIHHWKGYQHNSDDHAYINQRFAHLRTTSKPSMPWEGPCLATELQVTMPFAMLNVKEAKA
jgi:hypothetical protein